MAYKLVYYGLSDALGSDAHIFNEVQFNLNLLGPTFEDQKVLSFMIVYSRDS